VPLGVASELPRFFPKVAVTLFSGRDLHTARGVSQLHEVNRRVAEEMGKLVADKSGKPLIKCGD
jgi:hypothetical protein